MIRRLMIPVAGTIAALVVIVLAHEPRGKPLPPEPPPFDFPEPPEHSAPPAEDEPAPSEPQEFQLELGADGTFLVLDVENKYTFASIEDLSKQIGDVRHTLVISNGDGVPEAALDAALAQLRDRFQVRKVYRAPEAPPGDGR